MFLLRRYRQITVFLLGIFVSAFLISCACQGSDSAICPMQPMHVYNAGSPFALPMQIAGDMPVGAPVFYYEEQGLDVCLYVADSNEPAVLWINGKKYPFSYGYGYSPMESEAPHICVRDVNGDAKPDVLLYGSSYRTELRQDVYLSNENGSYTELGDITDITSGLFFHAEYMDHCQIHISAPDWGIDETRQLDEKITAELVSLGVYEGDAVTEYGSRWEINRLQGKAVEYVIGEDGELYMYYEVLMEAGYSEYTAGYGFRLAYRVQEDGYELKTVSLFGQPR